MPNPRQPADTDAQVERDIGVLAREILTLVHASGVDPVHKPFAVLS